MEFLNTFDNHFLISMMILLGLLGFVYFYSIRNQKIALKKIEKTHQHQDQMLHQTKIMILELKRANRLLAELAGTELPAYEPIYEPEMNSRPGNLPTDNMFEQNSNFAQNSNPRSSNNANDNQFKLYVGNLDYAATEDELARHFAYSGLVEFVNIPVNRYTGKARGFGFVTFSSKEDADRAMNLNGSEFRGRQIQVNFAKERE